ncbi:MAG: AMP-binding protein [Bryobacteraceae bacterium]
MPLGDRLLKQTVTARLEFLRQAQWWPRQRLDAARESALRQLAYVSYREFPFYRALFDEARVGWEQIRTPADLRLLPIVTKSMIRSAFPHAITRDTGLPWHDETTSGSTGEPLVIREDSGTASLRRAAFLLSLEWAGWRIGDPHVQTGAFMKRGFERTLKDWVFRCHYVSALNLDNASLDRTLHLIERKKIRHLWGFPSILACLARRAAETGWNRRLDTVVTWADTLYPQYRAAIENTFGAPVFDTYGVSEGMQIAAQCGHGLTYHVNMLDTIVELVDAHGYPVPPGQPGRVILTRLHAGAMPFIRYEVGDVAVAGAAQPCSCGRDTETLEGIQGRETDLVVSPSGRTYTVHFFMDRLEQMPEIREFQVVNRGQGRLLVRMVAQGPVGTLERTVESLLREGGLTDMRVEVERVSHIPVSRAGKRRFVLNEESVRERELASR